MKDILLIILYLFLFLDIHAQSDNFLTGARAKALSGATVALSDHWAGLSNPAGLAFMKESSAGIFVENRFNIKELCTGAMTLNLILSGNRFNFNFYSFNNSVFYSKQKYGLAYALTLGKSFSAGLEFDLLRTRIEEYGKNLGFCGEFGIIYKPLKKLTIGMNVFNPAMTKYTSADKERIPTTMRTGAMIKFSGNTLLLLELSNSSLTGFSYRGGIENRFSDKFSVQLGARNNPFSMSFGLEFKFRQVIINIALQYQQVLDTTPGVSFDYIFSTHDNNN